VESGNAETRPQDGTDDGASVGSDGDRVDLLEFYWSVARRDLRLTDVEFLELTPYTLDLLIKRLEQQDFKTYHASAQVAYVLAESNRDPKQNPEAYTPWDFIPEHLWPKQVKKSTQKNKRARFDKAGNVGHTNLKKMTGAEQQDFLSSMLGVCRPKKTTKKKAIKK
jgi:hypothetical protein